MQILHAHLAIEEEEENEDAEEKYEVRLVGRAVLGPKVVTKALGLDEGHNSNQENVLKAYLFCIWLSFLFNALCLDDRYIIKSR